MRVSRVFFACFLLSFIVVAPVAQNAPQPKVLTNSDIINMVKAGLAESTITLAIEQGQCKFDTSPNELVNLKNQGVSPAVLEAMLRAEKYEPPSPSIVSSAPSKEGISDFKTLAEGAYYKDAKGWTKLQQLSLSGGGATHVAKMAVPGLTPHMVWTFRGAEAPVQITEGKPVFYVKQSPYMANVAGRSERDIVIVRFDKKKGHRELQMTSGASVFTFKSGFSKEKTPDITVTRVSESVISVTPNQDLLPGEYLLTYGLGFGGYDFGITGRKAH